MDCDIVARKRDDARGAERRALNRAKGEPQVRREHRRGVGAVGPARIRLDVLNHDVRAASPESLRHVVARPPHRRGHPPAARGKLSRRGFS
jgi:hypothetical protein